MSMITSAPKLTTVLKTAYVAAALLDAGPAVWFNADCAVISRLFSRRYFRHFFALLCGSGLTSTAILDAIAKFDRRSHVYKWPVDTGRIDATTLV